jgi:hypothetical protein
LLILLFLSAWFLLKQDAEIPKEQLKIKTRVYKEAPSVVEEPKQLEKSEITTPIEVEEEVEIPTDEIPPSDPYEALRQSGSASSASTDTSSYLKSVQKLDPGMIDDSNKDKEAIDPYLELRGK